MLERLHSPFKDLQFVCEGETRWVVDTGDMYREAPDSLSGRFQGTFAYRQDGAVIWDVYAKPFDTRAEFRHDTYAQLGGRSSKVFRTPDRRSLREPVQEGSGSPGILGAPISPQLFFYLGYWRSRGYSSGRLQVDSVEWDETDGNSTLHLKIDETPQSIPKGRSLAKVRSEYWLDMKRGGHVLLHERYRDSRLIARTHRVLLQDFKSPGGQKLWLPVHAEFETFWWLKGFSDTPLFREIYDVVLGSVVLNAGLSDERFSVRATERNASSPLLRGIRSQFDATPPRPQPPRQRTDPAGIEDYQAKRLAAAEAQARQLDASPRARPAWDTAVLLQGGLALVGSAALISAVLLKRTHK